MFHIPIRNSAAVITLMISMFGCTTVQPVGGPGSVTTVRPDGVIEVRAPQPHYPDSVGGSENAPDRVHTEALARSRQLLADQEKELAANGAAITEQHRTLNGLTAQGQAAQAKLDEARAETAKVKAKGEDLQHLNASLDGQAQALAGAINRATEGKQKLEQAVVTKRAEVSQLDVKRMAQRQAVSDLDNIIRSRTKDAEVMTGRNESLAAENNVLEAKNAELKHLLSAKVESVPSERKPTTAANPETPAVGHPTNPVPAAVSTAPAAPVVTGDSTVKLQEKRQSFALPHSSKNALLGMIVVLLLGSMVVVLWLFCRLTAGPFRVTVTDGSSGESTPVVVAPNQELDLATPGPRQIARCSAKAAGPLVAVSRFGRITIRPGTQPGVMLNGKRLLQPTPIRCGATVSIPAGDLPNRDVLISSVARQDRRKPAQRPMSPGSFRRS